MDKDSACREAFEQWYAESHDLVDFERLPDGQYIDWDIELGWDAWQAAWNRRSQPEGWKLVPIEPTPEMKGEGINVDLDLQYEGVTAVLTWDEVSKIYRAMIAAAPQPPTAAPGNDGREG